MIALNRNGSLIEYENTTDDLIEIEVESEQFVYNSVQLSEEREISDLRFDPILHLHLMTFSLLQLSTNK